MRKRLAMRFHSISSVLPVILSARIAGASPTSTNTTDIGSIEWGSCNRNLSGLPEVLCGNLTVPLDYTNKTDSRTITLRLIKSSAKKQPAPKGSILLNYGGPGQDGVNGFLRYFTKQRKYIGEDHDMISWDPRATRDTLPANCIDATEPNAIGMAAFGRKWHDSSDVSGATNWAEGTVLADACYSALRDVGRYVGMAATARDAMAIVDALKEDGMLRYWGLSGGTALGATVAAMFPDRMDRIILDGVMNAHQYYHDLVETEWFSSSEMAFRMVMDACVEIGPEKCPIARSNSTGEELIKHFERVFAHVRKNPIPVSSPELAYGSLIDYTTVMDYVYTRLYAPPKFQYLIRILEALSERNATKYQEVYALDKLASPKLPSEDTVPAAQFAPVLIRCGDRFPRTNNAEDVDKALGRAHEISPNFGYYGANLNAQLCAQWRFEAVERYAGDFNVSTKNPVLFLSNSVDPATPIVSARNMSSSFHGSVLLEQESVGHVTFMTQESNCTRDAILAYLADGELPEKGTKCKANLPIASYVAGEFEGLDQV